MMIEKTLAYCLAPILLGALYVAYGCLVAYQWARKEEEEKVA